MLKSIFVMYLSVRILNFITNKAYKHWLLLTCLSTFWFLIGKKSRIFEERKSILMAFENIDVDQKELFKNASRRIREKKRLVYHLVFFVAGFIVLAFVNLILNYGEEFRPFDLPWYLTVTLIWAFFLIIHAINVLIVGKLMGRAWEERYMNILVEKQLKKIKKLQKEVDKKHPIPLQKPEKKEEEDTNH